MRRALLVATGNWRPASATPRRSKPCRRPCSKKSLEETLAPAGARYSVDRCEVALYGERTGAVAGLKVRLYVCVAKNLREVIELTSRTESRCWRTGSRGGLESRRVRPRHTMLSHTRVHMMTARTATCLGRGPSARTLPRWAALCQSADGRFPGTPRGRGPLVGVSRFRALRCKTWFVGTVPRDRPG